MISRKFAIGILVFELAIASYSVHAQNTESVSSLLSRATSAIQKFRPHNSSDSSNFGSARCVGVIPKGDNPFLEGSGGADGVVTCQNNGVWSSPFIVRATSRNEDAGVSTEDIIFLTYGYWSEHKFDSAILRKAEDAKVFGQEIMVSLQGPRTTQQIAQLPG